MTKKGEKFEDSLTNILCPLCLEQQIYQCNLRALHIAENLEKAVCEIDGVSYRARRQ